MNPRSAAPKVAVYWFTGTHESATDIYYETIRTAAISWMSGNLGASGAHRRRGCSPMIWPSALRREVAQRRALERHRQRWPFRRHGDPRLLVDDIRTFFATLADARKPVTCSRVLATKSAMKLRLDRGIHTICQAMPSGIVSWRHALNSECRR